MAGSNQRRAFHGSDQFIFSNARLFPVAEFADRGDAFVPRTTLNLEDYDMVSNRVALENEPCHLHLHWNWHWHCHWLWQLPSPPQQMQIEALHQTERLLDEPEDFLLYDYYDSSESEVDESDPEDIDVGGLDLEGNNNVNNVANQSALSDKQERVKAVVVGAKRKIREEVEMDGSSTAHCRDHEYVLEDFQQCKSPLNKCQVGKKSCGEYTRTVWDGTEGEDQSKRFCNNRKDF